MSTNIAKIAESLSLLRRLSGIFDCKSFVGVRHVGILLLSSLQPCSHHGFVLVKLSTQLYRYIFTNFSSPRPPHTQKTHTKLFEPRAHRPTDRRSRSLRKPSERFLNCASEVRRLTLGASKNDDQGNARKNCARADRTALHRINVTSNKSDGCVLASLYSFILCRVFHHR